MRDIELHRPRAVRAAIAALGAGCVLASAALAQPASPAPGATTPAATATSRADRNVYAAGGQVRSPAGLNGDFAAAGGKVVVDQPVPGDVNLAGGSVDVRAPVGDDLRAMGGDISIENKVGGELLATGGNITLTPAASVARGAVFYGGKVEMNGRVDGDLKASARNIVIDGEVRGNAKLAGEQIELGPHARIGGALSYTSPSELKKAEGATIAGALTRVEDGASDGRNGRNGSNGDRAYMREHSMRGPSWVGGIMSFLAMLAVAALFILAVPRFGDQAAGRIQSQPLLSLGLGFGAAVAVPVLAVLLFITILGIPLGIAVMALYPALLLGGFVVGVLFVAQLLVKALHKPVPTSFGASLGYFALALLLMLMVASVPFVGGLLAGLLGLAGIGACVLELHARRKGPPPEPPESTRHEHPVMPTPA